MLAVTDRAADLIKQAVEANELPEGAGVRIAPHGAGAEGSTAFAASLADSPEGEDNVVEVEGARVFLDPGVVRVRGQGSRRAGWTGRSRHARHHPAGWVCRNGGLGQRPPWGGAASSRSPSRERHHGHLEVTRSRRTPEKGSHPGYKGVVALSTPNARSLCSDRLVWRG